MEILLSTTKSLISIVVVLLLLSVSLFITFSDSPQFHLPLPSLSYPSASCPPSTARRPLPLKVFMYDLPRRFNFDMLDQGRGANGGAVPEWSKVSGLKRQHSIEYWMTASLLVEGGEGKEAVRVSDGDEAEVFFVPFFSSLSFNTHGRNMTDPETEKDHQLQIDLLDYLNKSMYWQRSEGLDHVIPMHHPNAFRFLRDRVNASILVVVDFGRYPKYLSSLKKDVVTPYVHVVDTFNDDNAPDPFESRPTLLYFRGRTIRKDDFIRIKLAKMLKKYDEVRIEESFATGEGIKASTQGMRSSKFCLHPAGDTQHQSTQGMRSSKFCLHPAGDTPSSCRLFDAIVSHCVPVIISDHIELPFEDEIDYSQFSLFFSVHDALQPDFLVSKLREVTKERWVEMWAQLKNISHHFEFQNPPKEGDAVNMLWREVRHKVPSVRLAMHRNHRLKIPDWWTEGGD